MESNRLIVVGRDLPSGSFIVITGTVCVTYSNPGGIDESMEMETEWP